MTSRLESDKVGDEMAILQSESLCETHGDTTWYLYGLNAYHCDKCDDEFWEAITPKGVDNDRATRASNATMRNL